MGRKRKPIYGVGINDSNYPVTKSAVVNGRRKTIWNCPYYSRWTDMLRRCYSSKDKEKYPSYEGCSVCQEWLIFSNFKSWMEAQYWEGKELDKDLRKPGCKLYSPDTCCFVTSEVNTFLLDSKKSRGSYPLGVRYTSKSKGMCKERSKPYSSQISGKRFGKNKYLHLGYYASPEEAHKRWQTEKLKQIVEAKTMETDPFVVSLLETFEQQLYLQIIKGEETLSLKELL